MCLSLSSFLCPSPRFKLVDTAGVRKRTAVASSKDGAEVGLLAACVHCHLSACFLLLGRSRDCFPCALPAASCCFCRVVSGCTGAVMDGRQQGQRRGVLPAVVAHGAAQLLMLPCVRPSVAAAVPRCPSVSKGHLLLVAAENRCLC